MRLTTGNLFRFAAGIVIWILVIMGSIHAVQAVLDDNDGPVRQIEYQLKDQHLEVWVEIPPLDKRKHPKVADPVKCALDPDDPRDLTTIGEVREVETLPNKWHRLQLVIWERYEHLITLDTTFDIFGGPHGFKEIVQTIFDEPATKELERRWALFVEENRDKLKRTITPLLESTLNEFVSVVRRDLEAAFANHQSELWEILQHHYETDIRATLFPMLKSKADPRINAEIIPLLMDCVQEMWEKAPAGSFAWNAFRDKVVPWDNKDNLKKRFVQWLDDEGKDVINKHLPGIMDKCEDIGEDLLKDQEVRQALADLAEKVINNEKLHAFGKKLIQEAILDNPKSIAFLEQKLQSPEFLRAGEQFGGMIEPYVRDMIDSILLDPRYEEKKINPNLVRLLRAQILWKKDFWLLAHPGSDVAAWDGLNFKRSAIEYGFD